VQENGLDMGVLAIGAGCIVLWALTARRLARWNISSAMAMVALGLLVANRPLDLVDLSPNSETVRLLTELALALVLFSDASRVNVGSLRADRGLPSRLLFIGLPITIALGFVAAALLTDLDPWLCALVASALAPTDAALGAPVVVDPHVPARIRRTLNVESGLNDGIVTPVVTFFLAGAVTEAATLRDFSPTSALVDLGVGTLIGIAFGFIGGRLLVATSKRSWNTPASTALVVPTLALASYFTALHLDVNGFIAAFVGGLAFGSTQTDTEAIGEFGEQLGELVGLVVWLLVGALAIGLFDDLTWGMIGFALLALTVLRMAPVALALAGGGLSRTTVLFIGWFGPRGLASIVFGIIALDDLPAGEGQTVVSIILLTVMLSVFLHGITASPLARRYGERMGALGDDQPEHRPIQTGSPRARRLGEHGADDVGSAGS
jgi:NhaP-type Na+/H+ or K+/H+ antiporter